MFNPDLKKLLKGCNSRYSLVVGTAKRAREIRDEAIEREEPIDVKTVSVAIDEILDGKYVIEEPDELKSNKIKFRPQSFFSPKSRQIMTKIVSFG